MNSKKDVTPTAQEHQPTMTVVINHFQEVGELKTLLKGLEPDIHKLIGEEVRTLVATRKGRSVGNIVCKNTQLCQSEEAPCTSKRCRTCPLLAKEGETFDINGLTVTVPPGQHCKKKNIIYLGQCQLCLDKDENAYAGKSMQKFSNRINGHRSHFKPDDLDSIDKSAFSLHAHEHHQDNFDLNNYKMMIYKATNNACNLHRLESVTIDSLRTNILGLNRMNTQK